MLADRYRVKAIILDLDGTLVDSVPTYFEAAKAAFKELGRTQIDINTVVEIPKRLEQDLPIDNLLKGLDEKRFLETYLRAYYEATRTMSRVLPGIQETLERLSRTVRLGVVTRRRVGRKELLSDLKRMNVLRYFGCIVTGMDGVQPKPSPQALLKCLGILDASPGEGMITGDSVVDIRAGKRAGAFSVAVLTGIFTRTELAEEKPDLILESLNDLPSHVEPC